MPSETASPPDAGPASGDFDDFSANGSRVIVMRQASKWYGPVIGVNEVSLELGPGSTGLLGPNGAGKSTLMKLLTGQLRPSLGEVLVFGRDVARRPWIRRRIGFLPEADAFHEEMTGREFVRAMARLSGLSRRRSRRATEAALERTGMAERGDKPLRGCSKGMRQRIKLAQALVHDPPVLLLDEPLSGIDPPGRAELMGLFRELRDEGKTILVSTHILQEVESITDRIVLMARGRVLAAGTVGGIRDLLEEHPLTVRLTCSRRRAVASEFMGWESVAGVTLGDARTGAAGREREGASPSPPKDIEPRGSGWGDVIVKTRRPMDFFRALPAFLTEREIDVERIEALDASVEAVFHYLVSGAGFENQGGDA